ncbi:MBL fold metallo-hydrolase [Acuticoccus sp. I52.16.1]|uniref:MBL fold metallo-hydrolase n=1 Tax=Acuticoccus sp. I52.16.1 TaxID=2928472 RepID=UPI001FD5D972|nr:MBL fold metallo-hydrolase [Acuticoccus sp. I52.16.1]UOM37248.1 MBL fold metallo-hydrolase [Acuticoccus sp. I52.16.1]
MATIDSGPLRLRAIQEFGGAAFRPEKLLPDFDPAIFDEAPATGSADFYVPDKGRFTSSIHSWLFRLGERLVLVDTCMGQGKDDPQTAPFMRNLAAAGVRPEDIDLVVLTHLHTDHMKWTTRHDGERFVPTFPNARYVAGAREYAHWQPGGAGLSMHPVQAEILAECVAPLMAHGRLDLIGDDDEIAPGLRAMPVPGHTATQLALHLDSGGRDYVFAADSLHHPVQIHRPHWGCFLCEDQVAALDSRLRLLDFAAATGAVLMPSHFGGGHAGLVHRDGDGFAFEPVRIDASEPAAAPSLAN